MEDVTMLKLEKNVYILNGKLLNFFRPKTAVTTLAMTTMFSAMLYLTNTSITRILFFLLYGIYWAGYSVYYVIIFLAHGAHFCFLRDAWMRTLS
jgi:hypothetical protein